MLLSAHSDESISISEFLDGGGGGPPAYKWPVGLYVSGGWRCAWMRVDETKAAQVGAHEQGINW